MSFTSSTTYTIEFLMSFLHKGLTPRNTFDITKVTGAAMMATMQELENCIRVVFECEQPDGVVYC